MVGWVGGLQQVSDVANILLGNFSSSLEFEKVPEIRRDNSCQQTLKMKFRAFEQLLCDYFGSLLSTREVVEVKLLLEQPKNVITGFPTGPTLSDS